MANFNITFGEEDKPMLAYFDTIIYPAFKSSEKRKSNYSKDTYFFFEDVEVRELKGEYVLVGNLIKKTKVEIKTDHVNGKLIEKNEVHTTAPFSRFIILLKNHRMILVKNQKESPTLKNFEYTFDKNAKDIIKKHNQNLVGNSDYSLRYPSISTNVVALPISETVKQVLHEVDKINSFKMRFFPLNGDLDFSDLCRDNRQFIESLGAKTGNLVVNSPTSKKNVATMIDTSSALVECTMNVKFKNGLKGQIKSQQLSGSLECEIEKENISEESDQIIIDQVQENPGMSTLSEENYSVFKQSIELIKSFIGIK